MKRILIVDDDPSIQMLYEEELSLEGHDIITSDGEKGLLHLIAAKRPDLILLSVKLRNRSGLCLLHDIRNAFHGIPVIVTTDYPVFKLDPKSVGADAYVTKSSDLTRLKKQIETCLATGGPPEKTRRSQGKGARATDMKLDMPLGMHSQK